jgi:hypothetical protein
VEKLNFIFGLNATLSKLWNADCSRVLRTFEVDADEEGREGAESELVSLIGFTMEGSSSVFSLLDCVGTVFVTMGLATEDDVARLPRLAQFAPAGSAEESGPPVGLVGE